MPGVSPECGAGGGGGSHCVQCGNVCHHLTHPVLRVCECGQEVGQVDWGGGGGQHGGGHD